MVLTQDVLRINKAQTADDLAALIKKQIRGDLKKEGAVIGISGGIDSSVCAALAVKALGKEKVLGLIMPETDSNPDSESLADKLAAHLGIETILEPITKPLSGFKCYERRNDAIKRLFPKFDENTWKAKIVNAANLLESDSLNFFKLVVETPDGELFSERLPRDEYLQIVAASNFKQRTRTTMLYYHAERLNRAVIGTGNKNEHELGFFVKYGDGGADLKPISHLFKTQVFQLAEGLDIPDEIKGRVPTTDTYSAEQTQTEFFYGVDFPILDLVWYALENDIPLEEAAATLNLDLKQVERVARDIKQKKRSTEYLRKEPLPPT